MTKVYSYCIMASRWLDDGLRMSLATIIQENGLFPTLIFSTNLHPQTSRPRQVVEPKVDNVNLAYDSLMLRQTSINTPPPVYAGLTSESQVQWYKAIPLGLTLMSIKPSSKINNQKTPEYI